MPAKLSFSVEYIYIYIFYHYSKSKKFCSNEHAFVRASKVHTTSKMDVPRCVTVLTDLYVYDPIQTLYLRNPQNESLLGKCLSQFFLSISK